MNDHRRPSYMPEVQQFSQEQAHIVQRPEGLNTVGDLPVEPRDVPQDLSRYADIQASPGRTDDMYGFTTQPVYNQGGENVLLEKDLGWNARAILCDNWTNQWLSLPDTRRFIPPYSGGWTISIPKGMQKIRVLIKAPSATYAPAAVIAGEFAWFQAHESYLPPASGFIDRAKTAAVV